MCMCSHFFDILLVFGLDFCIFPVVDWTLFVSLQVSKVNLVGDRDNFVWKGHGPLTVVSGDSKYNAGFQPQCLLQINPPAACTALAVHTEWQL